MKRIIAMLLAAVLVLACFTGCGAADKAKEELAASYVAEEYYPEEIEQIEALIAEYSLMIDEASDKEAIEQYKTECIEKIGTVLKKEEARADALAQAEELFASMIGKVLTYQDALKFVEMRRDARAKFPQFETAGEIRELTASIKSATDEFDYNGTYEFENDKISATFECEVKTESDGGLTVDVICSESWEELTKQTYYGLQVNSYANDYAGSLYYPSCVTAFFALDQVDVYWSEDGVPDAKIYSKLEDTGVAEYADENTLSVKSISKEKLDMLTGSGDFINHYGEEIDRNSDEEAYSYIVVVLVCDSATVDPLEHTRWVILL